MNITIPALHASHVNIGTSSVTTELGVPERAGRVMRMPTLHVEVDERSEVTPYGGLALVSALLRRFDVADTIDRHVQVLKAHKPYHESDHVLALAMSLFVGGTCLEDLATLQNSEAVRRMMGACRLPDPTTAGDFLRRFTSHSLAGLRQAVDEVQGRVWKTLAKQTGHRRRKRPWGIIDLDGHIKELYGTQKEGADFSRTGKWSYQPLLVSMAGSGECLAIENQPGNLRSSHNAAQVLSRVLPRVSEHFEQLLVRADSDFDRADVREACDATGAYFAIVGRAFSPRPAIAQSIPERAWKPFQTPNARRMAQDRATPGYRPRRKRGNRRRRRARQRGYRELRLTRQWIAEVPWTPSDSDKPYRLVIRRQLIKHYKGQQFLFEDYRYRFILTDLPPSASTARVVDLTYERCDQENLIEQMGSGLAAWRMPVAGFVGNSVWLEIARLAWNLGKWLAQLVLPDEVVRWEWKRFRQAWVYIAAQVIRQSRQIRLRISASHRFASDLLTALTALQI